jgi:hypothetical protein
MAWRQAEGKLTEAAADGWRLSTRPKLLQGLRAQDSGSEFACILVQRDTGFIAAQ